MKIRRSIHFILFFHLLLKFEKQMCNTLVTNESSGQCTENLRELEECNEYEANDLLLVSKVRVTPLRFVVLIACFKNKTLIISF